ncbi:hypothetical protein ACHHYP_16723 [Achlya hypogyna]|uniref:Uncharacterized protein n=1 Tax=Achlya hypogyna TaxID=1202772 RepID=A0A1V9Y5X6_ACHHY|nr:hypothetical protein ACHHYP_16723 [Achlya hypogyna]
MDAKAKYKERYATLHKTYESRLQSLAAKFEATLRDLYADESLALLQQSATSRDFVGPRLHELVSHALADEKEHFIRALGDKLARKDAALKETLGAKAAVESQKKALLDELRRVVDQVEGLQGRFADVANDKSRLEADLHHLRDENNSLIEQVALRDEEASRWAAERQAFTSMQQDYVRLQAVYAKDQSFYDQTESKHAETIRDLTAKLATVEAEKAKWAADYNQISLQLQEQTLSTAHAKESIASVSPRLEAAQDEIARLRAQVAGAEDTTKVWRRKYESVGEQIELLVQEQVHEKELMTLGHEKEITRLLSELQQSRGNAEADAARWRADFDRLTQQLTEREASLRDATRAAESYEKDLATVQVAAGETKVALTKRIAQLEQEVAAVAKEGHGALEAERKARTTVEEQFASYKRMTDVKLASLQTSLAHQQEAAKRDVAAEKRLRWQEDAMKKHEQMLDGLKHKYEASMATLQDELKSAKSRALEAASECKRLESTTRQEARHEASQIALMRQEVARLAASSAQSKVAETTSALPGNYVPLAEHKAELDKLTAQLTLKLESAHAQAKEAWDAKQRAAIDAAVAATAQELVRAKEELAAALAARTEAESALLLERKHNVQWRAAVDDERSAKTVLVQRLEEATVNLGRLKQLVQDLQAVQKDLEGQLAAHQKAQAASDAASIDQVAQLTAEVTALKDKQRRAKEASQSASVAMQALEKEALTFKTAATEREATTAALLQDKAATIELLQANLQRLEAREQSTLALLKQEHAAHIDRLQAQVDAYATSQTALRDELQALQRTAATTSDAVAKLTALLDAANAELAEARAKAGRQKAKYDDLRSAHQALEAGLSASEQSQQTQQHQMALALSDLAQQRQRRVEKAKLNVHTVRLDYLAAKRAIEHELDEERRYLHDTIGLVVKSLDDARAQGRRHHNADMDRLRQTLTAAQDAAVRDCELALQTQAKREFEAQRSALEASWMQRLAQETTKLEQARSNLEEKNTAIEEASEQAQAQAAQIAALRQQLDAQTVATDADRRTLHGAIAEKDEALAARGREVHALEAAATLLHNKIAAAQQQALWACDALSDLGRRVAPAVDGLADVADLDGARFKQRVFSFADKAARASEDRQAAAVDAAVKPFKAELEKAPLVLRRTSSAEYGGDSVLAMAAPLAQELAAAKERIEGLTKDMAALREKYDAAKAKYAAARQLVERLAQERDDMRAYAERLQRDKQATEHSLTLQLDEAFQQHAADLDRVKVSHSRELDAIRQGHETRLVELEKEVEAQERKHARLRGVLGQQESDFKVELEAMAKRYHAAKQKLQRVMEEMVALKLRASAIDGDRLRHSQQHRTSNPAHDYGGSSAFRRTERESTTMHDLSLMMEQSLKASQSHFYATKRPSKDAT